MENRKLGLLHAIYGLVIGVGGIDHVEVQLRVDHGEKCLTLRDSVSDFHLGAADRATDGRIDRSAVAERDIARS